MTVDFGGINRPCWFFARCAWLASNAERNHLGPSSGGDEAFLAEEQSVSIKGQSWSASTRYDIGPHMKLKEQGQGNLFLINIEPIGQYSCVSFEDVCHASSTVLHTEVVAAPLRTSFARRSQCDYPPRFQVPLRDILSSDRAKRSSPAPQQVFVLFLIAIKLKLRSDSSWSHFCHSERFRRSERQESSNHVARRLMLTRQAQAPSSAKTNVDV